MKRLSIYLFIILVIILGTSCAQWYFIEKEPKLRPSEDMALINFIKPSAIGARWGFQVWDGDKLIAGSFGEGRFQYECKPGKHLFVFWSEYKYPVEAELLPDTVYYIVLRVRPAAWTTRIRPEPVYKDHPWWEKVLTWEELLPNYTFDQQTLATTEAENKAKILKYLQYYEKEVKGSEHVIYLRPEDGLPTY